MNQTIIIIKELLKHDVECLPRISNVKRNCTLRGVGHTTKQLCGVAPQNNLNYLNLKCKTLFLFTTIVQKSELYGACVYTLKTIICRCRVAISISLHSARNIFYIPPPHITKLSSKFKPTN